MAQIRTFSESSRMELRAVIRLSSEIIAYYWPMRTFVHHNPLHGLEDYPFAEAVRHGERILGGRGYLPIDTFRDYYGSGRILPRHLNEALKEYDPADTVEIDGRSISRVEVLRARLIHAASAPALDEITHALNTHPDRDAIAKLADYLGALRPQEPISNREAENSLRTETLAAWCDRTLNAQIVDLIDREMIKWSAAFLDEGHATWGMPRRERGFYSAWKFLAQREWSPCGIERSCEKIARLPEHAEDALLESLDVMKIGSDLLQDYLSLHLAALAGWAGFIKWRADQSEYEWQRAYPMDLVQYLAVRLWYERELVQDVCSTRLGVDGNVNALRPAIRARAQELERSRNSTLVRAWRLAALARALEIEPMLLAQRVDAVVLKLLEWLDALPETELGRIWLTAFEAGYEEQLIGKLRSDDRMHQTLARESGAITGGQTAGDHTVRLQAQAVFCIDVRSESLRRHIEAIGDYETFGFAGFFAVFIRHQALGSHHETDQFPVIVNAKNLVREIPRTYHSEVVFRREHREKLLDAAHTLLYDLKENVLTPYVMVESLGWFYSLPFVGRSLFPDWYRKTVEWLRQKLVPHVATTLTVDKLSRAEVEEMLAAEQRVITRRALQAKFGDRNLNLSLERLDFLRRRAIDEESAGEPSPQARSTALTPEEEALFVEELRRDHGIDRSASFARMERITRTGFTVSEQVLTVATALKIIGLTSNFARLVLVCGHGSRSENNPYESALDCGACGGNGGKPNARAFAIMANKPQVREQLAQSGIVIPQDTYFIAGQHNTATDEVELFDLEDLPPTHRRDVLQLSTDLARAGSRNSQERCTRFPEIAAKPGRSKARREVRRRSSDWSEVRPEWGLSGNAAFIIGPRSLTRGIDLAGRVFLMSYDYREDRDGKLLENVLTGPQIVGQWISMEHYFSTVDQDVYGSGSKIYHNVAGRTAVMAGPQSDLRTGLAWQTVMNGARPFHEPMRMLTIIEAPRERIDQVVHNQTVLRRLYDNEWVRLIAIDPADMNFYRYVPKRGWELLNKSCSSAAAQGGEP